MTAVPFPVTSVADFIAATANGTAVRALNYGDGVAAPLCRFAPGDAVVVATPRHDTAPSWHGVRGSVVRIDPNHAAAYIVSAPRDGVNVDVMFYDDELTRAS